MTSIILPARSAPQWTGRALASINYSVNRLAWKNLEFILMDDDSEPDMRIVPLFVEFRKRFGLPCKIVRFKTHQHYSRVFSAGLSLAKGEKIFFLSNDMIFTPDFFRVMMEVSDLDKSIGIVRGTSRWVDSLPQHEVIPSVQLKSFEEIVAFSHHVASEMQRQFVEDSILSADAVLINRTLVDMIGVPDPIYFGYFGDIDYGLRAMRAGFKLICAKGAWLFHEGAGYIKDWEDRIQDDINRPVNERMRLAQKAYEVFRLKWNATLPLVYDPKISAEFPECRNVLPIEKNRYVPSVMLSEELCEVI